MSPRARETQQSSPEAERTYVPLAELLRLTRTWLATHARSLTPSARAEYRYGTSRRALIESGVAAASRDERWMPVATPLGEGLDERVVEYPWVFSRLGRGRRLLDVGSTLNQPALLPRLAERFGEIVFLNPYRDDGHRSVAEGISYVCSDIRTHWLQPATFDRITCISTLEHVGCDNSRYGAPGGARRATDTREARAAAMRSMRRLLAPGGTLLLTVPFGRLEEHDWFVQLDDAELAHAIAAFGAERPRVRYFAHHEGWREVAAEECRDAAYGTVTRGSGAIACVELEA